MKNFKWLPNFILACTLSTTIFGAAAPPDDAGSPEETLVAISPAQTQVLCTPDLAVHISSFLTPEQAMRLIIALGKSGQPSKNKPSSTDKSSCSKPPFCVTIITTNAPVAQLDRVSDFPLDSARGLVAGSLELDERPGASIIT